MSEWQSVKLGELVDIGSSKRIFYEDYVNTGIPFYRSKEVIEKHNGNDISTDLFITKEKFEQIKEKYGVPQAGDLLLTSVGTLGIPYIVEDGEEFYFKDGNLTWFKNYKSNLYNKFLYYWIISPIGKNELDMMSIGSTQAALTIQGLKNLDLDVPPIEEQKAIASVLSSLDDKIDLLHRQNNTLECMAETLFRQWFVEEAQEDWKELPLGDLATVQNGYAFSSSDYVDYQEDFLEVFKMGHIQPGGGLRFSPKADFVPRIDKLKRWILNKNDIVMAMTDMKDNMGILGHPALTDISNKYVLNQRVARIYLESNNKLSSIYLLYLQLSTEEAISLLQSKANSGVQVNLTTEAIKSIPITIPPTSIQNRVLETIQPIFEKLNINRTQIQTLEKLRDTLLPKLMSGEMRVNLE